MHSPITFAGIESASQSHAVCVIDDAGSAIERDDEGALPVALEGRARHPALRFAQSDEAAMRRSEVG